MLLASMEAGEGVRVTLVRRWCHSVLFGLQGGAISILAAAERPTHFSGMVLISPLVLASPESASTFKVRGHCSL